ncbi:TraM recognition site of TraD and TraG [Methylomagnum ishizawai]|uniref:TraM recognition site of TraD and TraG n=1 Tax=Methylomagnum ishizawai TaxID=1760988 RepID=A0A1Y6DCE8_9GAMM|nr:TraM recognition domain-containing protein [Methylomagnum ishizawai]SMF97902.1 TraM recognition site of TraD and TraG [Methylomagnum ishizawai]
MNPSDLPDFHPLTVIRDWRNGEAFRIADALTGVCVFGATGSGKTSGAAKHLAMGYLAADFGGLVLCAKKEERRQWEQWAREAERSDDLVIVDASGKWRFNFLDWEASRAGEGGGLTINIVALLDEIASAIAGGAGKGEDGGENKFFEDALHHMNINLVDLPLFAGLPVSLPLLRSIVNTAPRTLEEAKSEAWQQGTCAAILREGEAVINDPNQADNRDDYEECRNYWLQEFPALSEKTRSIITLSFSMLVRPFITRPLRKLFSTDTNIKPEDAFNGKIIIIDLPVQEFRLAGRVANLVWKYCFQVAVLRRIQPKNGYLRPVFLWADEAQNFITEFDAEYQAVARSAGGCTVYLTQNRESYRRVLGNNDAVDSLLGNLQAKFFCQNSGETNEWAAKLLGERWLYVTSTNVSGSSSDNAGFGDTGQSTSGGISRSEQRRYFIEPSTFTTLKRGGDVYGFQVEAVVYKGGHIFKDGMPFKLLTFNQR